MPLSIQKSAAKSFATTDSKIDNKTMSLSIQKSTASNYTIANLEIDSQVLHHCLSRNQQPQPVSLPIQKSSAKTTPLPIHNRQPNYAVVDSEIDSQIVPLSFQKPAAKSFAVVDSEIDNKTLRYRFKNWQPQTVLLLILKLTAKYCVVAYPEIDNHKLYHCRSRNQQQRIMPVSIQKSVAIMESFFALIFGCLHNMRNLI